MKLDSWQKWIATGILAWCALAARAQSYSGGDLLLCFRNACDSSVNDLIVDIGPFSGLSAGTLSLPTAEQVGALGNLADVRWTLSGGKSVLYQAVEPSLGGALEVGTVAQQNPVATSISNMGIALNNAHANPFTPAQGAAVSYTKSIGCGNYGSSLLPLNGTEGSGAVTLDLYRLTPSGTGADPALLLGHITLNANETVSFTPVPEARNFGLFAGGSLLGIVLFKNLRFNRQL